MFFGIVHGAVRKIFLHPAPGHSIAETAISGITSILLRLWLP
jgi:hypothetical protein